MGWARQLATTMLRLSAVNRAARAIACARGHRLVLVYHRIGVAAPRGCEIVPSVPLKLFRAQLQALGEVVEFVPLDRILAHDTPLSAGRPRRPAVAITFDDDLPSHVEQALPVLREVRVPATFFLSGRVLHGLGAYWFQQLEALLITCGERRTAAMLHLPESAAAGLLLACERNADLRRRVGELAADLPPPGLLQRDAIAALGAAGMTIGFHTVEHEPLPDLDDFTLEQAASRGCRDLASAASVAVRYFAYPHGKADSRSAVAVRHAGFDAAFTGVPQHVRHGDDPYRLGRWEPGPLEVDDLLARLAVRLHRSARRAGPQVS